MKLERHHFEILFDLQKDPERRTVNTWGVVPSRYVFELKQNGLVKQGLGFAAPLELTAKGKAALKKEQAEVEKLRKPKKTGPRRQDGKVENTRAPKLAPGSKSRWHTNGKWIEPKSVIPNVRNWKMDRGDATFMIFGPPVNSTRGTYSAVVSGGNDLKPFALGEAKTLNLAKALVNKWIKRAMAS